MNLGCKFLGPVLAEYSVMTGRSSLKVTLAKQVEWLRRVDLVIHRVAALKGLCRCAWPLPLPFHGRGYPGQPSAAFHVPRSHAEPLAAPPGHDSMGWARASKSAFEQSDEVRNRL